jgi:hypothetical protein
MQTVSSAKKEKKKRKDKKKQQFMRTRRKRICAAVAVARIPVLGEGEKGNAAGILCYTDRVSRAQIAKSVEGGMEVDFSIERAERLRKRGSGHERA